MWIGKEQLFGVLCQTKNFFFLKKKGEQKQQKEIIWNIFNSPGMKMDSLKFMDEKWTLLKIYGQK